MSNQAQANTDLFPMYQCHKKVRAAKIKGIEYHNDIEPPPPDSYSAALIFGDGLPGFFVTGEYMTKHRPKVGGYWVLYEDGYQSFSPAEAFEGGYTRID